jgi:maltose alpha-D-glucosyltransferase/alpha-amylase
MENDRRKIELLKGLLLSMPGTPVLYYGDEIGMGDNVFLGDRDGVRTPMQWSFDRNGGFSRADPARLYLPPIMDPVYGFEAVNVEAQSRSPSSLLNWTKRLIAARRTRRALGRGSLRFLYPSNRKVLAYLREWEGETILCVANLARTAQAVQLDLGEFRGRQVIEVLGRSAFPPVGDHIYLLTLQPYSFFWFELAVTEPTDVEAWLQSGPPEFVTLVMPQGWRDLFSRHNRPQLERDVLPAFLPRQRWFGAMGRRISSTRIAAYSELSASDPAHPVNFLMPVVEATLSDGDRHQYLLPMAAIWSPSGSEQRQALLPVTLAEVRHVRNEGAIVDAVTQDGFVMAVLDAMCREATLPLHNMNGDREGEIRFRQTPQFAGAELPERVIVHRLGTEPWSGSVLFEEYAVLKVFRRLQPGTHPEIEMPRFLIERAGFLNTPPPLATIEMAAADNEGASAAAVLFGFVRNQGNGWNLALDYLLRYLDDALNEAAPGAGTPGVDRTERPDPDHFFLALARRLGLRTAQLHRALAEHGGDDPAFSVEPITPDDLADWRQEAVQQAEKMLQMVDGVRTTMSPSTRELADAVLSGRADLLRVLQTLAPDSVRAVKTRFHGDFHLGQVIAVQNDFYIIDFEGDPALPTAARRRKSSPLRDVAAMIRSFDYATATAVRQIAETRPAAVPRALSLADAWRQRAVDGFRAAYRKETRGSSIFPASKLQGKALIDFFTLDKAVSEVAYELVNRPDWVAIPLNGILRLLAKANQSAANGDRHAVPSEP